MKVTDERTFLEHQAALAVAAVRGSTRDAWSALSNDRGVRGITARMPWSMVAGAAVGGITVGTAAWLLRRRPRVAAVQRPEPRRSTRQTPRKPWLGLALDLGLSLARGFIASRAAPSART